MGLAARPWAVVSAWLFLFAATALVERLSADTPPIVRMFALIITAYFGMKLIVTAVEAKESPPGLAAGPWLAFTLGWAGMRPALFRNLGSEPVPGAARMIAAGLLRVLLGLGLILGARALANHPGQVPWKTTLVTLLLLTGYSLVLHFGVLQAAAGFWRMLGVRTHPLFNAPLRSLSLREFWGRRWNVAFSEMTSLAVYRPLRRVLGPRTAFASAFLFSGALHELAISLPVRAGFGLPFLYFALQAAVQIGEDWVFKGEPPFAGRKVLARLWVYFWILAPAPILFHHAFLRGVVWPLAGLVHPD